jgi:hypothetical protein
VPGGGSRQAGSWSSATTGRYDPLPLEHAAQAHERVDAGARDRVLLTIPD